MTDVQAAAEAPRAEGDPREWRRPAALLALLLLFSVARPAVLIGLPFAFLVLALPVRRAMALLVGAVAVFLGLTGGDGGGLWYAERGWAILAGGWFAALTARYPGTGFLARALGAVAGAGAVAAGLFMARPGAWSVLDWAVAERLQLGVATAVEALRLLQGSERVLSPALLAGVYGAAEAQAALFPALIGLGTIAGLGVAWWLYVRLGLGVRGALGPLRRFSFSDQMVWLFVGGLALLLAGPDGGWERVGSNAVVFMGALYAVRGAGVFLFLSGGISVLGAVALTMAFLFVSPVIVAAALVIGLSDTWLDLRARLTAPTA